MIWSADSRPLLRYWLGPSVLIALMLVMQFIGLETVRLEPRLITEQGEWWRLLTGHLVHANASHLLMNAAGLVLCVLLTRVQWNLWGWLWRVTLLCAGVSLGLMTSMEHIGWYVGFSGVLYGLFMLSAMTSMKQQPWMSVILILLIGSRVLLEEFTSINFDSSEWIGVPVLSSAHFYGVVSSVILMIVIRAADLFALKHTMKGEL